MIVMISDNSDLICLLFSFSYKFIEIRVSSHQNLNND
jgi:hypothetical protein